MENGAFSDDLFKGFGDKVVLFCHNTSQVEDEPYPKLLSEKGGRGFPFVAFLDAEGDVIAPQGYDKLSVKGFEETLEKINVLFDLEQKAKAGDKSAETPLFICKIKLGRYNFAEASAKRKKLPDESVAQKKEIDKLMIGLEVQSVLEKVNYRNPDSVVSAGEKFLAMKEADRIPEGRAAGSFWAMIMMYAEKKEDLALMEKAFESVKKAVGDGINKRWVSSTERRIERLREKVKEKEEAKKEGSGKGR